MGMRPTAVLLAWLMLSPPSWAASVRLVVSDSAGRPVPDAVVYLRGASPVSRSTPPPSAVVDQRDKVFVPQVTVIEVGAEVRFPNSDSVSHHVYSFARPNAFELPLYRHERRPTVRFEHAGVVTLGCNIHDAMVGWIVVVDSPYFARASALGEAVLADVPPGQYAALVWSPRLDPTRPLEAGALLVPATGIDRALSVDRRLRAEPRPAALAGGDY